MFPGAGATIYYNDAGEPTGWDTPGYNDPPEYDPDLDLFGTEEDYEEHAHQCRRCQAKIDCDGEHDRRGHCRDFTGYCLVCKDAFATTTERE